MQTAQRLLLGPPPQGQLHLQGALPPVLEEPEEEESATSATIEDAPPQQQVGHLITYYRLVTNGHTTNMYKGYQTEH